MDKLFFDNALLPSGWAQDVEIIADENGIMASVTPGAPRARASSGAIAVPGICNLHSHAFQRAMAGLGERRGEGAEDDFWSWRDVMYRFVERLQPEDNLAIATQLYVEMLEAGFTGVAEFHYLHHQPSGAPYDNRTEMADAILAAADKTGIGLTLLPVLYAQGGFDGASLSNSQRRFQHDADSYLALIDSCCKNTKSKDDIIVGAAAHSLRAVTPEMLDMIVKGFRNGPMHIHIAEQVREVEDCIAWSGARPVEWLLDHQAVDERWCLVHATHMTQEETRRLAISGAVAGLCPTTEANLGDGIFNAANFFEAKGAWGIGSDSHIRVDAAEDLRLLELSQRLRHERRLSLALPGQSNGRRLLEGAAKGGAQALVRKAGRIAPGEKCDIVVLDEDHPALIGKTGDEWLDSWIFAGDKSCVRHVWVSARQVVHDGVHTARQEALSGFKAAMARLRDA